MMLIFFLSFLREEIYPWYAICFVFSYLIPQRRNLCISSNAISFGLLLSYAPFMLSRNIFWINSIIKNYINLPSSSLFVFVLAVDRKFKFSKSLEQSRFHEKYRFIKKNFSLLVVIAGALIASISLFSRVFSNADGEYHTVRFQQFYKVLESEFLYLAGRPILIMVLHTTFQLRLSSPKLYCFIFSFPGL